MLPVVALGAPDLLSMVLLETAAAGVGSVIVVLELLGEDLEEQYTLEVAVLAGLAVCLVVLTVINLTDEQVAVEVELMEVGEKDLTVLLTGLH